jgi:hypothetical protein
MKIESLRLAQAVPHHPLMLPFVIFIRTRRAKIICLASICRQRLVQLHGDAKAFKVNCPATEMMEPCRNLGTLYVCKWTYSRAGVHVYVPACP